jgi:MoxR-like ATPase
MTNIPVLRLPAEQEFADELARLRKQDRHPRPAGWKLSPRKTLDYLTGACSGTSPKYIGQRSVMELAIAALTTDRALLLTGPPGVGKSVLAEHLCAAISHDSSLVIQGTASSREETVRYGWNYARLIAEGPTLEAVVCSPLLRAMQNGTLVRIEELTRMPGEVQDSLLSILSEKALAIPELNLVIRAKPGFNIVATANLMDQGVYPLSQALKRRFCMVELKAPATLEEELEIVRSRLPATPVHAEVESETIVRLFRELRSGMTEQGRRLHGIPAASLSTAEAIDVLKQGIAMAQHFGSGTVQPGHLAPGLNACMINDASRDAAIWREYCQLTLARKHAGADLAQACLALLSS